MRTCCCCLVIVVVCFFFCDFKTDLLICSNYSEQFNANLWFCCCFSPCIFLWLFWEEDGTCSYVYQNLELFQISLVLWVVVDFLSPEDLEGNRWWIVLEQMFKWIYWNMYIQLKWLKMPYKGLHIWYILWGCWWYFKLEKLTLQFGEFCS